LEATKELDVLREDIEKVRGGVQETYRRYERVQEYKKYEESFKI
jgi:hypothetical protein